MGSFFGNVQVRGNTWLMTAVVNAIRKGAEGADEVKDPALADRTVLVLPPDAGGFITVYDEAGEGAGGLDDLAAKVSRAARGHAFSVLVHDSDVLRLGLFRSGERRDTFDSYPDYFGDGETTKKKPKPGAPRKDAGDPRAWEPLLAPGHTQDDLRAAFAAEDLFAESTLRKIAEQLGCDPARVSTGYRYVTTGGAALPEGTVTLRFRAKERPAYEATSEGPPKLEVHMPYGEARQALAVGDELRLPFAAKNVGGASRGLTITVWGDGLTKELVAVERFEVLLGNVLAGAKHTTHVPEARVSEAGERLLVVDLPDAELTAGTAMPVFSPGVDVRRAMDAWQRAMVHVNVVGKVVAPGEGSLLCALVPRENRDEGAWAGTYMLALDPPFAKPLRAALEADMPGGISHLLRPLAGTRYLTALLAIDAPRADAASFAREALTLLRDTLGDGGGEVSTAIYRKDPGARPKSGKGKAKSLLFGKRLEGLVDAMVNESQVDVTVYDGPAFDPETGPRPAVFGLTFGTTVLPDREEARVPTLSLWFDTEAASVPRAHREKVVEELRAGLVAIVDRAMAQKGVQASLFRVGAPTSMGATAYETACRQPHAVGTQRAFVTRYLRVPGDDTTWLGRSLVGHLGEGAREGLARLGDVLPWGGGLRVTLRAREELPKLEEVLAPILPTFEEAHALVRAVLRGEPA